VRLPATYLAEHDHIPPSGSRTDVELPIDR
jgi:hypothetical protein